MSRKKKLPRTAADNPLAGLEVGVAHEVPIRHITRDAHYQPRERMHEAKVTEYRSTLSAGGEFPPVTIARIGGVAVLIDGWHRTEAHLRDGRNTIRATVIDATERDARWLAAKANMTHGIPLTRKEKRQAFAAFVRARQHISGDRWLTYQEIAKACPGCGGASTMHRWMWKDFPKVAEKMGGDRPDTTRDGAERDDDVSFFQAAVGAAQMFQWNASKVRDVARRLELWDRWKAVDMGPADEFDQDLDAAPTQP